MENSFKKCFIITFYIVSDKLHIVRSAVLTSKSQEIYHIASKLNPEG